MSDDPFADLDTEEEAGEDTASSDDSNQDSTAEESSSTGTTGKSDNFGGGGGSFAEEIFTEKIEARHRTFYIDVKKSRNGKFVKICEKSRGRKSVVMFDEEDIDNMIQALQNAKKAL